MGGNDDKLDFAARVRSADETATRAQKPRSVMLNVGLRCDLECAHCHHSCGPNRTETMSPEVALEAVELARAVEADFIDVTGGSPELWPSLTWLIGEARSAGLRVRVRTNLVALGPDTCRELRESLAENRVELLASLPGTAEAAVAAQRGHGTLSRSLSALTLLREVGYGVPGGPALLIAYNPELGSVGRPEASVEREMRASLGLLGVSFERLMAITNVPVGRAREQLERRGESLAYLHRLADAFNPRTVSRLACRSGIEVAWDGRLADCDFNLAAGLGTREGPATVTEALADPSALIGRRIAFARHCFACTAAAGSS